jgi:hypothetical protein
VAGPLTDADREAFYEQLSAHAAADQITLGELERRVALVAEAATREQAAEALADLPPLAGPPAERRPWRGRRYGDAEAAEPDWQPTNERFRDPGSGRVMRVWVDPSGGRHYLPDANG